MMVLELNIIPGYPKDFLEPEQHKQGSNEHELKHDAGGASRPVLRRLCFPLL
jgi:hypothetical protein